MMRGVLPARMCAGIAAHSLSSGSLRLESRYRRMVRDRSSPGHDTPGMSTVFWGVYEGCEKCRVGFHTIVFAVKTT